MILISYIVFVLNLQKYNKEYIKKALLKKALVLKEFLTYKIMTANSLKSYLIIK